MTGLLEYELGGGVRAFTAGRDVDLPCAVVQPHQTHSVNVVCVDRPDLTCEDLEGVDALVTDLPDVAIGVRTAGCIPVLLDDPVHRAIGAAHSGWRGTVNMISKKTVMEMCRLFGTRPENIIAVIGHIPRPSFYTTISSLPRRPLGSAPTVLCTGSYRFTCTLSAVLSPLPTPSRQVTSATTPSGSPLFRSGLST